METRPFAPLYGPQTGTTAGNCYASTTVTGTNGSATASAAFIDGTNTGPAQVRVANKSSAWAHINFGVVGSLSAATVASSLAVAPGGVEIFSVATSVTGASVILDAAPTGSGAVVFTVGEGL